VSKSWKVQDAAEAWRRQTETDAHRQEVKRADLDLTSEQAAKLPEVLDRHGLTPLAW
jgi:hypothetical protein